MSVEALLASARPSPDASHMHLELDVDVQDYDNLRKAFDTLPAPSKARSLGALVLQAQVDKADIVDSTALSLSPPSSPRRVTLSSRTNPLNPAPATVDPRTSALWYHGLPTSPRLLATTQSEAVAHWSKNPGYFPSNRVISPPGDHPIVAKWGLVAPAITAVLGGEKVRWSTVDLVRIGIEGETDHPVIVWIGIEPNTLDLARANEVLILCVSLVRQALPEIQDYAVEMREGSLFLASSRLPSPCLVTLPERREEQDYANAYNRTVLAPGIRIGPIGDMTKAGTGGFFLESRDDLFMVTARHVLDPTENVDKRVVLEPGSRTPKHAILDEPTTEIWEIVQKYIEKAEARLPDHEMESQLAQSRLDQEDDPLTTPQLRSYLRERIASCNMFRDCLEQARSLTHTLLSVLPSASDRVIGQVDYSPPMSLFRGFLIDFGLVRVDRERLPESFSGNEVNLNLAPFSPRNFEVVTRQQFPPGGVIKMSSVLQSAADLSANQGRKVTMAGGTSGNKIGSLGVASRIRLSDFKYSVPGENEAWAIPVLPAVTWQDFGDPAASAHHPQVGYKAFSNPGDSGAAVVTLEGEIVGVLVAGIRKWDEFPTHPLLNEYDITYLTPATLVLDMVRNQEGLQDATLDLSRFEK